MKTHYRELTPTEFRQRLAEAPIAYLPLGTLEWHGEHLPLGSDGLQSEGFMTRLAERVGGVVLPMLFLGPDLAKDVGGKTYYGMDIHGFKGQDPQQLDGSAYWVSDELFEQMLVAILTQLARAGFRIVVGHGHGPSTKTFPAHIDAWEQQFGLKLFTCWRDDEKDGLGIQTDHAAANETSLMMALHPHLVQMENLSPDPNDWPVAVSGKDPRIHASAEKGERAIVMQLDRMTAVLTQALAQIRGND